MSRTRETRSNTRTPVSGNRDVLNASGIPEGMVGRWVNDEDSSYRIQKFQKAGYEFVTSDGVTVGDRSANSTNGIGSVVSRPVGGGKTAYLMAQRKDWYEEDQSAKQASIDSVENGFRKRGKKGDPDFSDGDLQITSSS